MLLSITTFTYHLKIYKCDNFIGSNFNFLNLIFKFSKNFYLAIFKAGMIIPLILSIIRMGGGGWW
jgi:hypothetical protein